jgi:endogenous inhibitor of DNA gyrase (YacG/DUF329 family)
MLREKNANIISDMKHRCPVCRKIIDKAIQKQSRREKFYPFCSNRCKLIDLGRWIDGNYKIITELKNEEEDVKNSGQSKADGR